LNNSGTAGRLYRADYSGGGCAASEAALAIARKAGANGDGEGGGAEQHPAAGLLLAGQLTWTRCATYRQAMDPHRGQHE